MWHVSYAAVIILNSMNWNQHLEAPVRTMFGVHAPRFC